MIGTRDETGLIGRRRRRRRRRPDAADSQKQNHRRGNRERSKRSRAILLSPFFRRSSIILLDKLVSSLQTVGRREKYLECLNTFVSKLNMRYIDCDEEIYLEHFD